MRLLFAISIACFCAVLWVMLSLARRVRWNRRTAVRRLRPGAAREFFEAGEFRTPRSLTLTQDLSFNRQRSSLVHLGPQPPVYAPNRDARPTFNSRNSKPILSYGSDAESPSRRVSQGPVFSLQPTLSGDFTQHRERTQVTSINAASTSMAGRRKSPQSVSRSGLRRIDLSHYDNENSGDLTDPYTHPLRGSGTQGGPSSI